MDQNHSEPRCWTTPKGRHVHDDPFAKRRRPYPLRLRGSAIFKIWPQVLFIGAFSAGIVLVSRLAKANISISPTLTSVTGFVVALSITFRNQTAYERFTEGRRLWNQLQIVIRNTARIIWLQVLAFSVFADEDSP
jgi:predicted membrane chloride channel (bestrophin family)